MVLSELFIMSVSDRWPREREGETLLLKVSRVCLAISR